MAMHAQHTSQLETLRTAKLAEAINSKAAWGGGRAGNPCLSLLAFSFFCPCLFLSVGGSHLKPLLPDPRPLFRLPPNRTSFRKASPVQVELHIAVPKVTLSQPGLALQWDGFDSFVASSS